MKIIGQRLRDLRQNAKLSQARVAAVVGSRQSAVARYESGEAHVPAEMLVTLADYYDVSLDYIFGRTDNPQGKLYENKPKVEKDGAEAITLNDIETALADAENGSDLVSFAVP